MFHIDLLKPYWKRSCTELLIYEVSWPCKYDFWHTTKNWKMEMFGCFPLNVLMLYSENWGFCSHSCFKQTEEKKL